MSSPKKKPHKLPKKKAPIVPGSKKHIEVSPELEAAAKAARHFGFVPLPAIEIEKTDIVAAKRFDESHLPIVKPWTEAHDRFE
jgi:hypothetical protein